jgi:hypothetical protein
MFESLKFFAERANGHKGSARTGVVLMVSTRAADMNGICFQALTTPKGSPNAVPCSTWVNPSHLAKRCDEITQAEARVMNPGMFAHVERFERSPEYRAMHAVEIARAIERGLYREQPADRRIIANMRTSRPEETDGPTGWKH